MYPKFREQGTKSTTKIAEAILNPIRVFKGNVTSVFYGLTLYICLQKEV